MGEPGGLADCSFPGWYTWNKNKSSPPGGWEGKVGYINNCNNKNCPESTHEYVGLLDHFLSNGFWGTRRVREGKAQTQTEGRPCPQTDSEICGLAWDDYGICQKKEDAYSRDWYRCCSSNQKWSPKDGCNPYWYKDGDTYSNDCRNLCLGKTSYGLTPNIKETLKNDYNNGICLDVLKSNVDETELRKFCQSDDAYNSETGEPVKDYTDICGCYYPKDYYDKLIKKLKELYPELPDHSYNDKTCFSTLCANSKLKSNISKEQCPDQYFLRCINNAEFEAGGDMSGINASQSNNCNIYVQKGDFPFCGRTCDNDDNCVGGQCNSCIDGVCKNEDSVSCSNYSCPSNKIRISNALCVGDSSTCNENDCCIDTSVMGGDSGSPPSDNNENLWGKVLLYGGIVLIVIGIIGLIYSGVLFRSGESNVVNQTLNGGGFTGGIITAVISICLIIGGSFAVHFGKKKINSSS